MKTTHLNDSICKISVEDIPEAELKLFIIPFLKDIRKDYEDPAFCAEYEIWLENRNKRGI